MGHGQYVFIWLPGVSVTQRTIVTEYIRVAANLVCVEDYLAPVSYNVNSM